MMWYPRAVARIISRPAVATKIYARAVIRNKPVESEFELFIQMYRTVQSKCSKTLAPAMIAMIQWIGRAFLPI